MSRKKDLIGKKDLSGKKDLIGKKDPTGATGQQTAIFLLLFTLITLLILYSSNTSRESFQFSALKVKHRQPPNFKRVDIRSGYLPVRGNKTLHLHCQRCVVITSSSHLIGSHLGATIDDSECTVRMNDAPTTGYEKDVGSKTTFRVVAHSSVYRVLRRPQEFLNKTQETTLIFWGPPNKLQEGSKGGLLRVIQHTTGPFPNVAAYVVSPGKMKTFDDLFRGETGKDREKSRSWLSTGWFTMGIAMELCDRVHVYGMVPPNYCSRRAAVHKLAYHYYEPKGPDECTTYIQNERSRRGSHHRFITEKLVFAHWASLYNITFSHPRWFQDQ
ncbi:alpha-N-acetylgalactosaminide alpha-2,6-sialyltransferase 6 isoform X1 [Ambystoma mexicanum]|uniref:alpha-N-acetylgalactosaminide alpha-2,6-sialyltransferase 6 isoform X1 n=1 Tax=Ambystoma mexicanum TaxID=8296 RepID=UPI0037E97D6C